MRDVVFRDVGRSANRTRRRRKRRSTTQASADGFGRMLGQLGLASAALSAARSKLAR